MAKDIFPDPLLEMLEDDLDETLSFCDLPIYSDPADWEWEADRSLSSSSDDDQEFFEFPSEASNREAESIIFCGKLIPHRERPISTQNLEIQTCPKQSSNKSPSKVARVLASPAKSRWYRYMFGLARFPVGMELRDIKDRQSRRGPKPMYQSPENGGEIVRRRGKGWWGLLRLLGIKSTHHASTVVKSFTCI